MNFTGFLVKRRNILLALMLALAACCGYLIPKVNVIMEITYFLPDDSPMKNGLQKMEKELPGLSGQLNMLSVMLEDVADKEEEEKVLTELTGGLMCLSVKEKDQYTLYQFLVTKDCDYMARREDIKRHYGGDVEVTVDVDKNMPANIIPMIITAGVLVFIILLIMCSSVMEVLLFLFTTLLAVVLNMGSNLILGNVSYLTFTVGGVLQMILSMDYSIIVMNRYRQEKQRFPGKNDLAMAEALRSAAPAVLSSAFTTIMSLLMLMFMRLKIGMDMGLILSKGVLISMICNFTVLPALVLLFDKAITKTEKKVPNVSARKLAIFEVRWRAPLAALFVGIFVAAFILQKRTPIAFSAIWETEIAKQFPPQNPMILMYETEDEDAVPAIMDTLSRDPMVESCLSYPGLIKRGLTASEMAEQMSSISPLITEDILNVVYYAYSHPERDERLSINDIQSLTEELSELGLMPEGFDVESVMKKLMSTASAKPAAAEPAPSAESARPVPSAEPAPSDVLLAAPDTLVVAQAGDTVAVVPAQSDTVLLALAPADSASVAHVDSAAHTRPAVNAQPFVAQTVPDGLPSIPDVITYEMVTEQLTARQISERYGIERSYLNMIYRMAGRTRRPATMNPHEIFSFVNNKLLKDKRYSSFISKEEADLFKTVYKRIDSAFVAGPAPVDVLLADLADSSAAADSLAGVAVADSIAVQPAVDAGVMLSQVEEEPEPELTPLERLAEMAFSGRKYNSRTVRRALGAAGIRVSQEEMDLLYLYGGSRSWDNSKQRMSVSELVNYVDGTLLQNPAFASFLDDEAREKLAQGKDELNMAATTLRSDNVSIAAIMTDYEFESPQTFSFLERITELADRNLKGEHVIIAESAMYKEIKESFPSEMLLLTILTVTAIFLIVAITFRSLAVPVLLILAVLSGVYVNVFVSGLGGNTMYFMSYLIVQSILMGATIDYCILFTSYYRESRMKTGVPGSIGAAYKGASHSILTSGLIIVIAPLVMSLTIKDQMIAMILKCLASGALSVVLIIFLVLPGAIALFDFLVAPKGAVKSFGNK